MGTKNLLISLAIAVYLLVAFTTRSTKDRKGLISQFTFLCAATAAYFIIDKLLLRFFVCALTFRDAMEFAVAWGDTFSIDRLGSTDLTTPRALFSVVVIPLVQEVSKLVIWEYKISKAIRGGSDPDFLSAIGCVYGVSAFTDIATQFSFSISYSEHMVQFVNVNILGVVIKYTLISLVTGMYVNRVCCEGAYKWRSTDSRLLLLGKALLGTWVIHTVLAAAFLLSPWIAIVILAVALVVAFSHLKSSNVSVKNYLKGREYF